MISATPGTDTSDSEVTNITQHGFWIWLASTQREYFVPFNDYPAFKAATVAQILNMKYLPPSQLSWEELDIDIELDALIHPEAFPLSYKTLLA